MNLITFNLDDRIIVNDKALFKKRKKNILFHHGCQNNKLFHVKKNNLVANVHEFRKIKKFKIKYLERIFNLLIKYLTKKLNKVHNVKHSETFWKIIVGKWLYTFIVQSHLNWEILKKIEKKYKPKFFSKINLKDSLFIPENSWHAHLQIKGQSKYNLFHHWLITKMIIYNKNLKIKNYDLKKEIKISNKIIKLNKPLEVNNIFYKSFNNKFFYYNWAVPKIFKFIMMKKFKFINLPFKKQIISSSKHMEIDRTKFFANKNDKRKNFVSFVKSLFEFTIPKIFLEDYKTLEIELSKLNWPKKPKFILTTYPYYDEVFKYYCAKNNAIGSKIIITQHGYDNIFDYEDWFINKIFDKHLCWGDKKKKGLTSFLFTKNYKKKRKFKFKKKNKILTILYSLSEMEDKDPDGHITNFKINKKIFHSSKFFLENIKSSLKPKTEIKSLMNTKFKILDNSLKAKIKNKKFIDIKIPFLDIINHYNLSVHFFLGTPFFESLYLNKPSILVLNKKIQMNFDSNFKKLISKFIKQNICFEDEKKATDFINNNYENLESWWNGRNVQKCVDDFCRLYCKRTNNLDADLERLNKIN